MSNTAAIQIPWIQNQQRFCDGYPLYTATSYLLGLIGGAGGRTFACVAGHHAYLSSSLLPLRISLRPLPLLVGSVPLLRVPLDLYLSPQNNVLGLYELPIARPRRNSPQPS